MDQELQALGQRVERILTLARRLTDDNAALREQLASAQQDNERLQQRIAEARARVENALSRLPAALLGDNEEQTPPRGGVGTPSTPSANDSPTP